MGLTLDDITFGDTADFTTAGSWFERTLKIGAPQYGRSRHYVAGVDGANRKDYGFRSRQMAFECWYVDASADAVYSAIKGDMEQLAEKLTFSTVVGSDTYANCELDATASFHETPRETGDGLFHARATFAVIQTGL